MRKKLLKGWVVTVLVLTGYAAVHAYDPEPSILEDEESLQREITLASHSPTVRELLDSVQRTTHVRLEADPEALENDVPMGQIVVKSVPAWKLLEQIARTQFRNGQWKKTNEGYQLSGTRIQPRVPLGEKKTSPPSSSFKWYISVVALICVVCAYYLYVRRCRKRGMVGSNKAAAKTPDIGPNLRSKLEERRP
jgi:hypothetical protein